MIALGTIPIRDQASINEARQKILRVVEVLTGDSLSATRLAAATSELCRLLSRGATAPQIALEISRDTRQPALALIFKNQQPLPATDLFRRFFDEVQPLGSSNGLHAVRASKWLPQLRLEPGVIDQVKAVIARQSRDELMFELQQTLAGLEQRVAERTLELEQANERIRSSEERLKFALEGSSDGLWDWNIQTGEIYYSPRWEAILGFEPGEVEPHIRSWENLVHPEDSPGVREILTAYLAGETPVYEAEYRTRSKSGDWVWLLARGKIVERDEHGTPVRCVGTSVDITARKETEKALADQLAFTETLVDTIPNPIFAKGPDTRYITFNKAYERAFGVRREDYIGKTVLDLKNIPLETRQRYHADDANLLKTGGMKHEEVDIGFVDGKLHTVLQWVTAFELSDRAVGGLIGILADITEQKNLERQLAEANERMQGELNIGQEIQMSMLPLDFPPFPDRHELDIFATLHPAREVGGDFYDFFFIDAERFCFCIGDVSGKGVPAALFMAVTKTLIKSRSTNDFSTASILTHVNDELSRDNKASMFVTIFACILNVKTGTLVYTNAGHNPPYLKRNNGAIERLDHYHGPVVGAMDGMDYKEEKIRLARGDMLLLYTDGVTEAMDVEQNLFAEKRLVDMLSSRNYESVAAVVQATVTAVKQFEGEAEQADDITVLAVKFLKRLVQEDL